jgi:hypothetical protein
MRKTLIISISILGVGALFLLIISLQNVSLRRSFESEYTPLKADYIANATFERCNMNIFKPDFAKVTEYEDEEDVNIAFYAPSRLFRQTEDEWDTSYTGGTTVTNTTFPELVAMVKEDCSQFRYGYVNPDPVGPRWTYSKHVEIPEKTERAKNLQEVEEILWEFKELTQEQQQKIIENYGNYKGMTVKEVIEWEAQITEDVESGKFDLW